MCLGGGGTRRPKERKGVRVPWGLTPLPRRPRGMRVPRGHAWAPKGHMLPWEACIGAQRICVCLGVHMGAQRTYVCHGGPTPLPWRPGDMRVSGPLISFQGICVRHRNSPGRQEDIRVSRGHAEASKGYLVSWEALDKQGICMCLGGGGHQAPKGKKGCTCAMGTHAPP